MARKSSSIIVMGVKAVVMVVSGSKEEMLWKGGKRGKSAPGDVVRLQLCSHLVLLDNGSRARCLAQVWEAADFGPPSRRGLLTLTLGLRQAAYHWPRPGGSGRLAGSRGSRGLEHDEDHSGVPSMGRAGGGISRLKKMSGSGEDPASLKTLRHTRSPGIVHTDGLLTRLPSLAPPLRRP